MTRVKICGIQEVEHARVAVEAGADLLGFVLASSKRQVTPGQARKIARRVRRVGRVACVGVFVSPTRQELEEAVEQGELDYVQVGGEVDGRELSGLPVPVIRTFHVYPSTTPDQLSAELDSSNASMVHFDSGAGGAGGTGQIFDWDLIPALDRPVLLAGGLNPDNVGLAIQKVRPWGVDVSSGVERAGRKDPDAIRRFVHAAKRLETAK